MREDFYKECTKDLNIPSEWEDVSYKNDVCPSFLFKGWQIFINHIDPKQREVEEQTRFIVIKDDEYGQAVQSLFLETNEFEHVLKFLDIQEYLNSTIIDPST